jgi:hypothetical protein
MEIYINKLNQLKVYMHRFITNNNWCIEYNIDRDYNYISFYDFLNNEKCHHGCNKKPIECWMDTYPQLKKYLNLQLTNEDKHTLFIRKRTENEKLILDDIKHKNNLNHVQHTKH